MVDKESGRFVGGENACRREARNTDAHARRWLHSRYVLIALGGVLILSACRSITPTRAPSYRYMETVVVETPQGIRTGSSVIEVQMVKVNFEDHTNLLPGAYKGQAVAVNLPGGQTLFALLTSKVDLAWAMKAYQNLIPQQPFKGVMQPDDTPEIQRYRLAMALKGPQVLPRFRKMPGHPADVARFDPNDKKWIESAYPLLVRFRNIADPATVGEVDPDDLSASFGSGYKLKYILLEKTELPVSSGFEQSFKWMGNSPENTLSIAKNRHDYSLAATLSCGSFSTFGGFFRGS